MLSPPSMSPDNFRDGSPSGTVGVRDGIASFPDGVFHHAHNDLSVAVAVVKIRLELLGQCLAGAHGHTCRGEDADGIIRMHLGGDLPNERKDHQRGHDADDHMPFVIEPEIFPFFLAGHLILRLFGLQVLGLDVQCVARACHTRVSLFLLYVSRRACPHAFMHTPLRGVSALWFYPCARQCAGPPRPAALSAPPGPARRSRWAAARSWSHGRDTSGCGLPP